MHYRTAALLLTLTACTTATPAPAPLLLEVRAVDAAHARLTLAPAPAAARWEVRPAQECGGEDGPPVAAGDWPTPAQPLTVPARAGDLVTVTATLPDGTSAKAADCPN